MRYCCVFKYNIFKMFCGEFEVKFLQITYCLKSRPRENNVKLSAVKNSRNQSMSIYFDVTNVNWSGIVLI